jgi:sugar lactone lactonase YvrE
VYFADAANHVVRKIVNGGKAVTIAGDGTDGDSGDGGDALQASLGTPTGLALAADGTTLYVSDIEANRIRKITQVTDSSGVTAYQIHAVAGSGDWCDNPPSDCGDGTNPLAARFAGPAAIWVDPVQNVYIADTGDNTVRVVIAGGGVTTIGAGDLQEPSGITGDARGNVFVSDTDGARVLKIAPSGTVTTVLGTGVPGYNGTYTSDPVSHQPTQPKLGTTAEIDSPRGLATNLAGQLFVAEAGNGIVRRLDPSGYISLTAGKTINGDTATDTSFTADGQYANATGFKSPVAIAVTSDGQFVVSDAGYLRVREFGPYPFS